MTPMDDAIVFIKESDKLKNIVRKTRNFSNQRYENDAEHSWHICLMAITLQPWANKAAPAAGETGRPEPARSVLVLSAF